ERPAGAEGVVLVVVREVGPESQDRGRVRADGHEDDVSEVDDARDPELKVQPEHAHDVDEEIHQERRQVELECVAHAATSLADATSDRMPCGRTSRTTMRIAKATTSL